MADINQVEEFRDEIQTLLTEFQTNNEINKKSQKHQRNLEKLLRQTTDIVDKGKDVSQEELQKFNTLLDAQKQSYRELRQQTKSDEQFKKAWENQFGEETKAGALSRRVAENLDASLGQIKESVKGLDEKADMSGAALDFLGPFGKIGQEMVEGLTGSGIFENIFSKMSSKRNVESPQIQGQLHSGGPIPSTGTYYLQSGEYVLSRNQKSSISKIPKELSKIKGRFDEGGTVPEGGTYLLEGGEYVSSREDTQGFSQGLQDLYDSITDLNATQEEIRGIHSQNVPYLRNIESQDARIREFDLGALDDIRLALEEGIYNVSVQNIRHLSEGLMGGLGPRFDKLDNEQERRHEKQVSWLAEIGQSVREGNDDLLYGIFSSVAQQYRRFARAPIFTTISGALTGIRFALSNLIFKPLKWLAFGTGSSLEEKQLKQLQIQTKVLRGQSVEKEHTRERSGGFLLRAMENMPSFMGGGMIRESLYADAAGQEVQQDVRTFQDLKTIPQDIKNIFNRQQEQKQEQLPKPIESEQTSQKEVGTKEIQQLNVSSINVSGLNVQNLIVEQMDNIFDNFTRQTRNLLREDRETESSYKTQLTQTDFDNLFQYFKSEMGEREVVVQGFSEGESGDFNFQKQVQQAIQSSNFTASTEESEYSGFNQPVSNQFDTSNYTEGEQRQSFLAQFRMANLMEKLTNLGKEFFPLIAERNKEQAEQLEEQNRESGGGLGSLGRLGIIGGIAALLWKPIRFVLTKLRGVFSNFQKIVPWASKIGNIAGQIGGVIKKIFWPLTAALGAFHTIKGAIEGFQEEGIAGALGGAIKGLVGSLIMAPLDLVKNTIAWITDKLGLDAVANILRSFSFESLFGSLMDGIVNVVNGTVDVISSISKVFTKDFWVGLFGNLVNWIPGINIGGDNQSNSASTEEIQKQGQSVKEQLRTRIEEERVGSFGTINQPQQEQVKTETSNEQLQTRIKEYIRQEQQLTERQETIAQKEQEEKQEQKTFLEWAHQNLIKLFGSEEQQRSIQNVEEVQVNGMFNSEERERAFLSNIQQTLSGMETGQINNISSSTGSPFSEEQFRIKGQADSGIKNIPERGSYILEEGERVISPEQNQDLERVINNLNIPDKVSDSSENHQLIQQNKETNQIMVQMIKELQKLKSELVKAIEENNTEVANGKKNEIDDISQQLIKMGV